MSQNRMQRAMEAREVEVRPVTAWSQPNLLPEIEEDPDYDYRWIRTSMMGQADARNISMKFREGWVPVKASEHPEAQMYIDPNSRYKDAIEVGGLILCKTPKELVSQRNKFYQNQAEDQITSVDNGYMRENDPRMKKFSERNTTVTFGKGN